MITKDKIITFIITITLIFITHKLIKNNSYFVEENIDKISQEILDSQSSVLKDTIKRNTRSAIILGTHIKLHYGDISNFEIFAKVLHKELKGVSNLQVAPDGVVSKIYPLFGNEKAIGHDLFKDDSRKKEAFLAKETDKLTLAGPFNLVQGGIGIVARYPIYLNSKFWGFSSALIIIKDLIENTNLNKLADKNYIFRLKRIHPDTGKIDIFYENDKFELNKKIFTEEIIVPNGKWFLDIQYTGVYLSNTLIITLYILGVLVSILLGYLSYLVLTRPKELERANTILENKVKNQTIKMQRNLDLIGEYVLYSKTDVKGVITDVSDALCKLSGYTKEELIGQSHNIFRDPTTPKEFYEKMWNNLKLKRIWRGEFRNKAKSGHIFWMNSVITPEFDKNGEHIGYISIRHDITARKSFEEQQYERFQNSKMIAMGEMMGNIAHQWRQPLSAISTIASGLMLQKELNILDENDMCKNLDNIVKNTQHLSKTIDTFRDFMRIEKTKKLVVLQEIIESSILILSANLKVRNIELIKDLDEKNPVEIKMIANQFEQVVLNVLNNARDVLLEKEIKDPWIRMRLKSTQDMITLSIEDNGGGIPNEISSHIFEPYFTTKHQTLGTGLGLHMSFRIISENFGGNLYTKNTENGAKFFIEIPRNIS